MFEAWAGIIAAGGAIAGGAIGAMGAESAASTQAGAAENAQAISQGEFNTITAQEQPFIQGGYGGLNAEEWGLGIGGGPGTKPGDVGGMGVGYGSLSAPFTAQNFQQMSPAYNFQLQQGQQGVLNGDAMSQGSLSGSALKDLTNYNQAQANTSFNNAFNQYQTQQGNIFSRLSGLAGLGQNAATNTGQQGTALAGQAAQSAQNIGTANAAGTVGVANSLSGGLSSSLPWLYAGGAFNSSPSSGGTLAELQGPGAYGLTESPL